jgi:hypothetical protein
MPSPLGPRDDLTPQLGRFMVHRQDSVAKLLPEANEPGTQVSFLATIRQQQDTSGKFAKSKPAQIEVVIRK